ncbi:MAG: outer membrane beta-barrel protein [Terrimonas sp.]|nr:outer membrane beta-barrel protein [Terrimonas sp.]
MKTLFFLSFLSPLLASAQNFYFSGRMGIASYQGDLKAKNISLSQSKIFASAGAKYDLSEHIAVRGYFSLGALEGDDSRGTPKMQQRNLRFQTNIWEWEGTVQYDLFSLNSRWWTPYVAGGIGLFHFNPFTTDSAGNKVFLQPLSTEGQGVIAGVKKYHRLQFFIPVGLGMERALGENVRLGVEAGYRKLFTDYLDDVSNRYADQNLLLNSRGTKAVAFAYRGDEVGASPYPAAGTIRGSNKYKDSYFYFAFTLTIRHVFDKSREMTGLPAVKKEKKVGCPATRN